jgi:Tfp pilus assembly protein PilF
MRYAEAAQAYEQAAMTPGTGTELRVRTLLDAGECRDLLNQRAEAVKNYQAAVDAGPNTSRAETARKYLHSAYHGN